MEVVRAKNLGFCSGVKNAMSVLDMAYQKAGELGLPCYVYGDIVHNAHVVAKLNSRGIVNIDSPEGIEKGVVVIRTHGIVDAKRKAFEDAGFIIVDATCPVVLRNQKLVRNSEKPVIIIGYPGHSEVESLFGSGEKVVSIISSEHELSSLDRAASYNAIVQTTFSSSELDDIKSGIASRSLDIFLMNDICSSSQLRRMGVKFLSGKVDAVIVVGDRHSANSNELVEIAKKNGMEGFLVESVDMIPSQIYSYDKIGLTAGASTPSFVYDEVESYLRSIDGRDKQ